eukprot:sb/3478986/
MTSNSKFIFLIGMNNAIHSRRKYFPVQNLTNYVWLSISFPMRPRTLKLEMRHSVMFLKVNLTNFKKHDTVSLVVVQFNCSRERSEILVKLFICLIE